MCWSTYSPICSIVLMILNSLDWFKLRFILCMKKDQWCQPALSVAIPLLIFTSLILNFITGTRWCRCLPVSTVSFRMSNQQFWKCLEKIRDRLLYYWVIPITSKRIWYTGKLEQIFNLWDLVLSNKNCQYDSLKLV